MSTKTVKTSTVTPPPEVETTIPGTAAPLNNTPFTAGNATGAPSLLQVIAGMKSSSKLDQPALAYIDQIDRVFADSNANITGVPITTDKIEARAYINESSKYGIILLFAETHQSLDMTPPTARIPEVISVLKASRPDARILQSVVVSKEDYSLAGNMAAFLCNCFATTDGVAGSLSVENLKGIKISAITNIDMVRNYIRQISPHSVPARDDVGVLLCLEVPGQNQMTGMREVEQKPFLAITGYTRIMNPQDAATGVKFVPIPTITDVVSSIPNPSLLAMALPLAADAFIVQNLWTRPYATFRTGQPNLGNLITDPATKKPLFTDTADAFHTFIRTYMTNPFLAIDVTEGRARPLGIDELIYNRANAIAKIHGFLGMGGTPADQRELQEMMMFTNFTGTYVDKGVIKDTRCVDYLELAAKVTNHKEIEHLLLQPNQPQVRIEAIRGIFPEATKSLYSTTTIILDSYLVGIMASGLANAHVQIGYDMPASGNFNFSTMLNSNLNQFNNMSGFAQGFGRQVYNPNAFGNIYASLF